MGSIRLLVHESGAIAESYAYDVYGRPRVMAGAGPDGNWLTEDTATQDASAVGNPYLFTARRWDADTGLYHYRHRDVSPALGRFLQPDPLGYIDGMNLYAYVNNNPLNWVDPWGLCKNEPLFDKDGNINPNRVGKDGIINITDHDLLTEMSRHRNEVLRGKRMTDLEGRIGDTHFGNQENKNKIYRYRGRVFDGTKVNYIGVGQGFRYFSRDYNWAIPQYQQVLGVSGAVQTWNKIRNKHWDDGSKTFWAFYGYYGYHASHLF